MAEAKGALRLREEMKCDPTSLGLREREAWFGSRGFDRENLEGSLGGTLRASTQASGSVTATRKVRRFIILNSESCPLPRETNSSKPETLGGFPFRGSTFTSDSG